MTARFVWASLSLMVLLGCGSINESSRLPAPGALPAKKKELPWFKVPGGEMKTTLFYGPWQCNQRWMNACQQECGGQKRVLQGCMWLADIKLDWRGYLVVPPLPVESGGRLAIYHCCCNYPPVPSTEPLRKQWDRVRESFRTEWGRKFGQWPKEGDRPAWPGHHVHDLKHGGNPTDPNNILPVPPDVHVVLNDAYPACYAGGGRWSTVGPDLPYTDH
jgi:hypothetical protein